MKLVYLLGIWSNYFQMQEFQWKFPLTIQLLKNTDLLILGYGQQVTYLTRDRSSIVVKQGCAVSGSV